MFPSRLKLTHQRLTEKFIFVFQDIVQHWTPNCIRGKRQFRDICISKIEEKSANEESRSSGNIFFSS